MSVSIEVDIRNLDRALTRLAGLYDLDDDATALMTAIGAIGESQTRRRISDEKTGPDGQAWPPNQKGTSILVETGQHLLGSVAWSAGSRVAEWGASWEYAHVHQEGAVIKPKNAKQLSFMVGGALVHAKQVTIPARPFVGLSADNAAEIVDEVTDFLGRLLS